MENSGNLKNSLKHRGNTGKNLQPEGGIRKRRRKIWERAAFGIIEVNKISHHCNFLGKITGKIYRGTGKTQGIWKWNLCGHPVYPVIYLTITVEIVAAVQRSKVKQKWNSKHRLRLFRCFITPKEGSLHNSNCSGLPSPVNEVKVTESS